MTIEEAAKRIADGLVTLTNGGPLVAGMNVSPTWAMAMNADLSGPWDENIKHYLATAITPILAEIMAENDAEIERLRGALRESIKALRSLPADALGTDIADGHSYRDELLHYLKPALGGDDEA